MRCPPSLSALPDDSPPRAPTRPCMLGAPHRMQMDTRPHRPGSMVGKLAEPSMGALTRATASLPTGPATRRRGVTCDAASDCVSGRGFDDRHRTRPINHVSAVGPASSDPAATRSPAAYARKRVVAGARSATGTPLTRKLPRTDTTARDDGLTRRPPVSTSAPIR